MYCQIAVLLSWLSCNVEPHHHRAMSSHIVEPSSHDGEPRCRRRRRRRAMSSHVVVVVEQCQPTSLSNVEASRCRRRAMSSSRVTTRLVLRRDSNHLALHRDLTSGVVPRLDVSYHVASNHLTSSCGITSRPDIIASRLMLSSHFATHVVVSRCDLCPRLALRLMSLSTSTRRDSHCHLVSRFTLLSRDFRRHLTTRLALSHEWHHLV